MIYKLSMEDFVQKLSSRFINKNRRSLWEINVVAFQFVRLLGRLVWEILVIYKDFNDFMLICYKHLLSWKFISVMSFTFPLFLISSCYF